MKRTVLVIGIPLLLVVFIVGGCTGIPYEQYGAVIAENQAAEVEIASLNNELDSVKDELDNTEIELRAMQLNLEDAQNQYGELEAKYEEASDELTQIKETCPPRWFSSQRELEDWLLSNDVSEKPEGQYLEDDYKRALEIHQDALDDGYMVFVSFDPDDAGELFIAECMTIVDGDLYSWFVNSDELWNLSAIYGFSRLD
jgi:hypothetical protein